MQDKPAYDSSTDAARGTYTYFNEALHGAELLLQYAAEIGVGIDPRIRNTILHARAASAPGCNEETAANLLQALTELAARLRPVTAESLEVCRKAQKRGQPIQSGNVGENTKPDTWVRRWFPKRSSERTIAKTIGFYWTIAIVLAIIIVPYSLGSFLTSAISEAIRKDIVTANELAVKLTAQLRRSSGETNTAVSCPPPGEPIAVSKSTTLPPDLKDVDVITELQQYASTIRAIDGRARQLNRFVFGLQRDPFAGIRIRNSPTSDDQRKFRKAFQLPVGLPNLVDAANEKTCIYQEVRYFAQNLLEDTAFIYGAMAACILPVLYALLGACAYLLRSFENQLSTRSFTFPVDYHHSFSSPVLAAE